MDLLGVFSNVRLPKKKKCATLKIRNDLCVQPTLLDDNMLLYTDSIRTIFTETNSHPPLSSHFPSLAAHPHHVCVMVTDKFPVVSFFFLFFCQLFIFVFSYLLIGSNKPNCIY